MARPILKLTRTTAITVGLMALQSNAVTAQPHDVLSGIMVPPCGNKATEADAGTLGVEAFGKKNSITAEMVLEAHARDEVCINAKGKLKLRGESAGLVARDTRETTAENLGEALAGAVRQTGEEAADAVAGILTGEAVAADDSDAEAAEDARAAAEAEVEAETETVAETEASAEAETAAEVEARIKAKEAEAAAAEARAETEAAARAKAEADAAAAAEAAEAEAVQSTEPEQPAAEAPAAMAAETDSDGRTVEPAEVSETIVTEENSRSSSEDFASGAQGSAAATSGSGDKGLSNFEKFALGAAGIIALDAIIGNNREVVSNSGDRVILRDQNGDLEVLRDEDTLLRRPGSDVRTETFSDGSTRTTVSRSDGTRIVTIADATGRVIKRTRYAADGHETVLIDETEQVRPVNVSRLPTAPRLERPRPDVSEREALEAALRSQSLGQIDRRFTLRQVREYREVRDLMPEISIDAINFATGSAAIQPQEAEELFELGQALSAFIQENPDELFLVEGHTDAVGDAAYNLALSDRRAESVALALTEYFDVPPENMIIQGYGEAELLVPTQRAERANRRAVVRRITPLLR